MILTYQSLVDYSKWAKMVNYKVESVKFKIKDNVSESSWWDIWGGTQVEINILTAAVFDEIMTN